MKKEIINIIQGVNEISVIESPCYIWFSTAIRCMYMGNPFLFSDIPEEFIINIFKLLHSRIGII